MGISQFTSQVWKYSASYSFLFPFPVKFTAGVPTSAQIQNERRGEDVLTVFPENRMRYFEKKKSRILAYICIT
jgi:hypothetical protein